MKSIRELALREKRVLIRADFNVPMDANGQITNINRIERVIPTIKHALEHNARVIIASHLGRPNGEKNLKYTLEPVARKIAELMERDVIFFEDCVGMGAQQMVRDLKPGQILMLENLRFYQEELDNDSSFARGLAKLCDVYINDAFGVSHRINASVNALPKIVDTKGMGLLMEKEISELSKLLGFRHGDGFAAILGGAKVSDKIGLIRSLLDVADTILVGGAMAYTFLTAKGIDMGSSLVEHDKIAVAKDILKGAEARKVKFLLPVDHVAAESMDSVDTRYFTNDDFEDGFMGFDIGPETVELYSRALESAKYILWNGPMGVFEKPQFSKGSLDLAAAVAESGAHTVTGGGDSVSLMKNAGVTEKIDHISTGGGASLEFLKNHTLPGIEALK